MTGKIEECAFKVRKVLGEMGSLNLWEVRAILGEPRDFACEVLLWLAARGAIAYHDTEDQRLISLTEPAGSSFVRTASARPLAVGAREI